MNAYTAFLKEIGYLLPEPRDAEGRDRQCRRGDRQDLRTAAGRAAHQCALRAERGQCALGQPLRCLLRHRRDPARSERERQGLQQGARRQGDRQGKGLPRFRRAAGDRKPHRRDLLQRHRRPARGQTEERQRHRAEIGRAIRRLSGRSGRADRDPAGQQRHAHRSQDRSQPRDRQGRSGRRRRHDPGIGGLAPSSTWKTASPPSMPKTRCWSIATRSA